jgi:MFS family permease
MAEVDINYLAVLAASLVGLAVGAVWYGPLFGKPWMLAVGLDPDVIRNSPKPGMRRIYTISFILNYIMAYCLAMFIGNGQSIGMATLYGFLTGLPWIAFAIAINALYEGKSFKYILVNGGYWTVTFTLMGLIIGALQ